MAEANTAQHSNLSEEDNTRMCDPCRFGGVNRQAGTFCQDCSEYLCDTCDEVHRRFRATRDHELKPYDILKGRSIQQKALITSVMRCTVHDAETLTLFCMSHDVAICDRCNRTMHRRCEVEVIKDVVKGRQTKNDIALFLENTKSLSSDLKALKDSRENDTSQIQNSCRKYIQEVFELKRKVIEWIEGLAKDMTATISDIEMKLITDYENDIKAAGEKSEDIQDIINSFECLGDINKEATFVLMTKRKLTVNEEKEAKDNILEEVKPIKYEFHKSAKLMTLMSEITSMGTFQTDDPAAICFNDISSVTGGNINIDTQRVTRCVFMPDGRLIVCEVEGTRFVKLFAEDFKIQSEINIGSVWDVAVVSENQVIVSQVDKKCLQFLNISGVIAKGKTIPVGEQCLGVDFKNNRIYVTCNGERGRAVKILTMTGDTVNTFHFSQVNPDYLAVNSTGDRIVVSTDTQDRVHCYDSTGTTLYTYFDSQLRISLGVLFDSYDNFMVCGGLSNNLHVVNSEGTKQKILLTSEDGMNTPYCLAYRPSDKTLFVGQMSAASLVFKIN